MNNTIAVIIGLGNPGARFARTRHNIGFQVIDALADAHYAAWTTHDKMELATIRIADRSIILIKPQTFMNNSGDVIPYLIKKGITPEHVLVVHDELELPFGKIGVRKGGSHRGHNGLRSIIDRWGRDFWRMRIGISRPTQGEDVGDYVLAPFGQQEAVHDIIVQASQMLEKSLSSKN